MIVRAEPSAGGKVVPGLCFHQVSEREGDHIRKEVFAQLRALRAAGRLVPPQRRGRAAARTTVGAWRARLKRSRSFPLSASWPAIAPEARARVSAGTGALLPRWIGGRGVRGTHRSKTYDGIDRPAIESVGTFSPCRPFTSNRLVRLGDAAYYPDVFLVCGPAGPRRVGRSTVACQRDGTTGLPRPRDHRSRWVMFIGSPRSINQDTPARRGWVVVGGGRNLLR